MHIFAYVHINLCVPLSRARALSRTHAQVQKRKASVRLSLPNSVHTATSAKRVMVPDDPLDPVCMYVCRPYLYVYLYVCVQLESVFVSVCMYSRYLYVCLY